MTLSRRSNWLRSFIYGSFLLLGTLVHTARIDRHFEDLRFSFGDVVLMMTCWTWTNLLVLCCLSSAIGVLGSGTVHGARATRTLRIACARGFFVFVVAMAGQLVFHGTPNATAVPRAMIAEISRPNSNPGDMYSQICLEHFVRIAGLASLLSFLCGFDPRFSSKMIRYIEALAFNQEVEGSTDVGTGAAHTES